MKKVLVVGDSSINVFLQIPAVTDSVSIEDSGRLMQFRLGSKIQLEKESVTVGGNALNVAVGLARQGITIDFYSIIGKDADGDRIMDFLSSSSVIPAPFSNGVNSSGIQDLDSGLRQNDSKINLKIEKKEGVKTNVGYVVSYNSERFLLIDTSPKSYNLQFTDYNLQSDSWLFLSSIGTDFANTFRTLIEQKKSSNFQLAYNPSSNELKNNVGTYVEMIKNSDILFVNKKEMMKIIPNSKIPARNASQSEAGGQIPMEDNIKKLWELNRRIVVVTDGIRGSYCYDGQKIYFEPSCGEPAVEKTGAGDAYESGFLAEYLKTGDIQAAMKNGTENAASVIKYIGAVEGLLYK